MTTDSPLAAAYIEGRTDHMSGANGVVARFVVHATISGTFAGGARNNASYFQSPNAGGLAHYVVDPKEAIQCCRENIACWHAPPNPGSIGLEFCDFQDLSKAQQLDPGTFSSWSQARWDNRYLKEPAWVSMLSLGAKLTADVCKRHGLDLTYYGVNDLLAGKRGITTHKDVAEAYHQSDHTDPGPSFPMSHFIDLVRGNTTGEDMPLTDADKPFIAAAVKPMIDALGKVVLGQSKADGTDADATHYGLGDIHLELVALKKQVADIQTNQSSGVDLQAVAKAVVDELNKRTKP